MSEVVALHAGTRTPPPRLAEMESARLDALCQAIRGNRFLPAPAAETVFVGDGDYRTIGAEFLGHFVRIGGLRPTDRVLDIGCGIGRMAVPLTQYLDPEAGSYEGFDPVAEGIGWCAQAITPVYPRFRFQHLDIRHALYNPDGHLAGIEVALAHREESFDFAAMVSVATHLPPDEVGAYAREIARLLAPGGRLFMTAFVIGRGAVEASGRDPRLGFRRAGDGPAWYADPAAPLGAVGFDEGFLEATLAAAGLIPVATSLGHWRGRAADHYQDVIVATKPGRAA